MSQPLPAVPPPEVDKLLQALIKLADEVNDVNVQLTLTVAGTVISGRVISRESYRSALAESTKLSSLAVLPPTSPDDPPPNFIHLTDARYLTDPAHPMPSMGPGVLWRGRLSQVDGWHYGQFGATRR